MIPFTSARGLRHLANVPRISDSHDARKRHRTTPGDCRCERHALAVQILRAQGAPSPDSHKPFVFVSLSLSLSPTLTFSLVVLSLSFPIAPARFNNCLSRRASGATAANLGKPGNRNPIRCPFGTWFGFRSLVLRLGTFPRGA